MPEQRRWKQGDKVLLPSGQARIIEFVFESGNVKLSDGLLYPAEYVTPFLAPVVEGVGPDAPTVTNDAGAKQSATGRRLDLIPPRAILDVAEVLHHGATKYGADNWRGIPVADHLNHLLIHAYAYLAGDRSDGHLSHIACRALMAMEAPETVPEAKP